MGKLENDLIFRNKLKCESDLIFRNSGSTKEALPAISTIFRAPGPTIIWTPSSIIGVNWTKIETK